jgi:hypothetical protein
MKHKQSVVIPVLSLGRIITIDTPFIDAKGLPSPSQDPPVQDAIQ